ncbi:MAG: SIS domain-containing protein [Phycisphaeraceae bacterium]|nr:SIS domain-containing protein [Phycisphaeraceae bacterium]MCB9848283.1 SIS domain-containing protein [Phycisphaeraceae bacterium]
MPFDTDAIRQRIEASAKTIASLREQAEIIHRAGATIAGTLRAGGKVMTCGNGGSAAEALHLAEEMIGRYRDERPPLAAVCLNADPTALTCIGNDFGFDAIYARQVRGLGRSGDTLVVFSTSGKSPNVRLALEAAKSLGIKTIGLLGKGGGACLGLCDVPIVVDSDDTAAIQESHQVVLHLLLEAVEAAGSSF